MPLHAPLEPAFSYSAGFPLIDIIGLNGVLLLEFLLNLLLSARDDLLVLALQDLSLDQHGRVSQ